MSKYVLTLDPGTRFGFEGQTWELDRFDGDCVRLRRGATVRSVSTSALLGAATPLDDERGEAEDELLSTVALSALTAKRQVVGALPQPRRRRRAGLVVDSPHQRRRGPRGRFLGDLVVSTLSSQRAG